VSCFQSTKECLYRSLSWIDNELLHVSSRPEWPAVLHNLCMLHSAIRLRTRYKLAGWNRPEDFAYVGTAELWVSSHDACRGHLFVLLYILHLHFSQLEIVDCYEKKWWFAANGQLFNSILCTCVVFAAIS